MGVQPSMTDEELIKASYTCPHIRLYFKEVSPASDIAQSLSFAETYDSPQGKRIRLPKGIVLRIFNFSKTGEGAEILIAGEMRPKQMLEAVEKAVARGAYVSGACFIGAESQDWTPTFDRVMALSKQGPEGTTCQLTIPNSLRHGTSPTMSDPQKTPVKGSGCSGVLVAVFLLISFIVLLTLK